MLKILILCAANPAINPRPRAMIEFLKQNHQVYAMGICASKIENVTVLSYPPFQKRNFFEEMHLYKNVICNNWEALIYTKNRLEILKALKIHSFDLIICHDLVLLPIVLKHKKNAKILFDAREFYPTQNKTNLRWSLLFSKFNDYLCKTYLPQVDAGITVSKGLQELYKKHYGFICGLFCSLPKYFDIPPSPIKQDRIKIIYHGAANPNRKIEKMIEIAQYLQERFELDLMLINTDASYMQFLEKKVAKIRTKGKKISIIPPVKFEEIIPFSSNYDLGLYAISATTSNLKHALPNKFFEYIQARLGLIIVPNPEMIPFVQTYQNGLILKNFKPKTIAKSINALTEKEIKSYKENSHKAAKILNTKNNQSKIDSIIKTLFPNS